jgi:hypothetical protein
MSGADEAGRIWPTRRLTFTRLFVRGRSVAIGSADFGNVTVRCTQVVLQTLTRDGAVGPHLLACSL